MRRKFFYRSLLGLPRYAPIFFLLELFKFFEHEFNLHVQMLGKGQDVSNSRGGAKNSYTDV